MVELTGFEPVTSWLQNKKRRISANYGELLRLVRELSTPRRTTVNFSARAMDARWKARPLPASVTRLSGPPHAASLPPPLHLR
jgi:hypothetical protein